MEIQTTEEIKHHYHLIHELKEDQTIYSIIRHVSKSGMTRHIAFFYIDNQRPYWITYDVSELLGYKMNKYHDALIVGGCGMDMAFSVVNNLEGYLNEYYKKTRPKNSTYTKEDLEPFKLKSRIL